MISPFFVLETSPPYPNTSTAFRILRTQTSFPSTAIISASPAAVRSDRTLAELAGTPMICFYYF